MSIDELDGEAFRKLRPFSPREKIKAELKPSPAQPSRPKSEVKDCGCSRARRQNGQQTA